MIYRYTIQLAPVSKKNSSQILINHRTNRPFVMPSKQYKEYSAKAEMYLMPKPDAPIDYPVHIQCTYYMPTHRVVDTKNLDSAIHDILVSSGILADDCRDIVASTDGTRTYYDKENPRTEILIEPYHDPNYEQWRKRS